MARPQLKSLPPPIIYPLDRDMRKRWFVQFYIWHETKQVHIAKKVSGYINTFHVEGERLAAVQELKKNIEDLLKNGWIVGKNKASKKRGSFMDSQWSKHWILSLRKKAMKLVRGVHRYTSRSRSSFHHGWRKMDLLAF